jgi:periplasmic protein TonB
MFSESLLDSSAGRAQRGWSTFIAWLCQSCLIVLTVVLPLWHTNALPRVREVFTPVGVPPGAPPPKSPHAVGKTPPLRRMVTVDVDGLHAPIHIPMKIDRTADPASDPGRIEVACVVCVPGALPGPGGPAGVLNEIIARPAEPARPAPARPPSRAIVSGGVQQGFLIHQVQPSYPAIARATRLEGTVVLAAVINRDGSIQGLHAVSGPPMLIGAAIDAVRQWRYRPYLLNHQPVEVETQISVIFTLSR